MAGPEGVLYQCRWKLYVTSSPGILLGVWRAPGQTSVDSYHHLASAGGDLYQEPGQHCALLDGLQHTPRVLHGRHCLR